jgi:PAN domain
MQSRKTCNAKGYGRLGPIVASTAKRCDQSLNNGVQLNLMTSATSSMQWKFILIAPPSPPPSPSPPAPPAPPPSPPPRPLNFCRKTPTRKVYSGRRIASTLSGIRPCYPNSPRVASPQECCSQCWDEPTCIAFMFIKDGGLDCRGQGLPSPADTGACYLMDSYSGSYEPENQGFSYFSSKAFT